MKYKTVLFGLVCILLFIIGIVVGMLIGTYTLIDHVGSALAGSTFIINLNETKMVDYTYQKFNETILPQLKQTSNSKSKEGET